MSLSSSAATSLDTPPTDTKQALPTDSKQAPTTGDGKYGLRHFVYNYKTKDIKEMRSGDMIERYAKEHPDWTPISLVRDSCKASTVVAMLQGDEAIHTAYDYMFKYEIPEPDWAVRDAIVALAGDQHETFDVMDYYNNAQKDVYDELKKPPAREDADGVSTTLTLEDPSVKPDGEDQAPAPDSNKRRRFFKKEVTVSEYDPKLRRSVRINAKRSKSSN
jgi:hypothetical protein